MVPGVVPGVVPGAWGGGPSVFAGVVDLSVCRTNRRHRHLSACIVENALSGRTSGGLLVVFCAGLVADLGRRVNFCVVVLHGGRG